MKRCLVSIVFLLVAHFTYAQSIPKVETGSIVRVENFSSKYITNRNIDIWLPQDYNVNKKYAVLYMQDGQMLFDSNTTWNKKSWMMQSSITKLIKENIIKEVIVVGIWNGGERRHSEYFPQKPFEMLTSEQKNSIKVAVRQNNASVFNNYELNADNYLKFMVEELKPFIDKKFSTNTNFDKTFIAGSSMGGLISMYAICEYPNVLVALFACPPIGLVYLKWKTILYHKLLEVILKQIYPIQKIINSILIMGTKPWMPFILPYKTK